MYRPKFLPFICLGISILCQAPSFAGPLTEARVTKIVNEVKVVDPAAGDRKAKLDDVIHDELALTTGIKSRSELLFQDDTLTRLGPESYFSFKQGTRDMTLQRGTLLLQVPKGQGGAKIHTAAVTASITGTTVMFEYVPQKHLKFAVLEGSMRLSMNGQFGDSLLLLPGRMVIMPPNAKRIPDPVAIDLKKLVRTSALINMKGGKKEKNANAAPLRSMRLIEKEIAAQEHGKDSHHLVETNLVILGKGTDVTLGSDELLSDLAARTDVAKTTLANLVPDATPVPVSTPVPTPAPTPNPVPTPNPNPPPSGAPPPPPAGTYITDATTTITTQSGNPRITTQGTTYSGVIYNNVATNGSPAGFLFAGPSAFDNEYGFDAFYVNNFGQSAVFAFDSLQLGGGITFVTGGGPNKIALVGNNGITNSGTAVINLAGITNILFGTMAGNIVLDSSVTFVGSADASKPGLVQFYARNGDLHLGADFNLPKSTLLFAAENNALFDPTVSISAKNLTISGLQTISFDGSANNSSLFQVNGGDVEIGGTVKAPSNFIYGSSATINGSLDGKNLTANVSGNFLQNSSGSFKMDGESSTTTITAADIELDGSVNVKKLFLTATNGIGLGGNLKTSEALTVSSATATLSGMVDVKSADFEIGGNFFLTGTGNFHNHNDSTINSGGNITIDGEFHGEDTVTLTATGNIAINHVIEADQLVVNAPTVSFTGGADFNGKNGSGKSSPTHGGSLTVNTGDYTMTGATLNLNGGDANQGSGGGNGGGNAGQLTITSSGNITLDAAISASSGQNASNGSNGGNGGTVNLTAKDTVTLNNNIEVSSNSGKRRSNHGGIINVTSNNTSGTAIQVNSSAQLLALLNSSVSSGNGGSIKFVSAGGDINMNGTATADKGTIEMTNNGATGAVTLTNATLAANTVKVGALGTNGTLTIGGGTISADSLIKLYAGGSNGTVNFVDNVTLSGNSVKNIAGDTVTIFNGKVVTVNGPSAANVFTNHPNYTGSGGNGSTSGTWAGKGATTNPLSGAPGY